MTPDAVTLSGAGMSQRVVVTAIRRDGRLEDVTHQARVASSHPQVARVSSDGVVSPAGDGLARGMAGAGIRGGQVVGASDARSEAPAERPITAEDVHATILRTLGVDTEKHLTAGIGRPIKVLPGLRVVRELFA